MTDYTDPFENLPIPPIVRLALEFQAAIDQEVFDATLELAKAYRIHEQIIGNKIDELMREIQIIQQTGKPLDIQWIRELDYYKSLNDQMKFERLKMNSEAYDLTKRESYDAMKLGLLESETLLGRSITMANLSYFNRLPVNEYIALKGSYYDGKNSPLAKLFRNTMDTTTATTVMQALENGIIAGTPLNSIAQNMLQSFTNISYNRALVISRTEILRAHRTATLDMYQKNGHLVSGYRRLANKRTACMACLLLDGQFFPINQAFTDHPNGACAMLPEVGRHVRILTGEDYFNKLSEAEQRKRMGNQYYDEWKKGTFHLSDMVAYIKHPEWGASPAIKPLWKLQGYNSYSDKLKVMAESRAIASSARSIPTTVAQNIPKTANPYLEKSIGRQQILDWMNNIDDANYHHAINNSWYSINNELNLNKIPEDYRDEFAKILQMKTYEEQDAAFGKLFKKYLDDNGAYISHRTDAGTLPFLAKDPRFKSQFEVGKSAGLFDPDYRKKFENNYFGVPKDIKNQDRPIYGAIANGKTGESGAKWYGDYEFVFKKDIWERCSLTFGDSLDNNSYNSWLLSPSMKSAGHPDRAARIIESIFNGEFSQYGLRMSYIEVQIFGQANILRDVEYLLVEAKDFATAKKYFPDLDIRIR